MASKLQLKEHRCPSCHAPLPVGPQDAAVTCRYCGTTITIERAKPPKVPPPHVPVQPVLYVPPSTIGPAPVIGLAFLLLAGAGGIMAIMSVAPSFTSLPASCPINGSLTIRGKTFRGTGTLIEANTNCTVTIEKSTLESDGPIVKGGINLTLKIVGSTLKSTTEALDLAPNAKVRIEADSRIEGGDAAIKADSNLELSVERSKLMSTHSAIAAATNAKISLSASELVSEHDAIVTHANGKLTAKDVVIKAKERGIHYESSNGELDARGLTLTAVGNAIFAEHNADIKLSDKCVLKSERDDVVVASGSNAKLRVLDSKIEGKLLGIRVGTNAKIQLQRNASVVGEKTALGAESNLEFTVDGATVKSSGAAVQGTSNARVRVLAGSMIQGTPAFQFSSSPTQFDVADGTFTGEKLFSTATSAGDSTRAQELALLRRTLDPSATQVKTCGSGGSMIVRFLIPPAGQPVTVTKLSSTVSKATEDCALAKLRAIKFPPRASATPVMMTYTF